MSGLSVGAHIMLGSTTQLDPVEVFEHHDSFCLDDAVTVGNVFFHADSVEDIDRFIERLNELRADVEKRNAKSARCVPCAEEGE